MERNIKYDVIPLAKRIVEDLPDSSQELHVADIGARPGFLSIESAKRLPQAKAIAVDGSKYMLDIAVREAKEQHVSLETVQTNIQNTDLDDEQFNERI